MAPYNIDDEPEKEGEDVEFENANGTGSACCDPRRTPHRFIVLIFICFLSFGSYFCFDNPAALQKEIVSAMKVNHETYMQLYAWYSWPNVVLCFFGGFLIDTVFGIRLGTIIFSLFVLAGQVVFALGALINKFWVMEAGRFIFGIGGESLAVAQNTYAVGWFKGKELNMVFGLQLSFSRVGSTVNMNVMGPIYKMLSKEVKAPYMVLGWALAYGVIFCLLSLFCALIMAYFDKRASRILKKDDAKTGEVIRFRDVKDFPLSIWFIFIICVAYYVAVFPFIGLGLFLNVGPIRITFESMQVCPASASLDLFFQSKYDLDGKTANACNSLVYLISAGASPILGFMVDKVGKNVYWLIIAVVMTIGAHGLLAFTFWNPFIAMVIMGVAYSLLACALWPLVAMVLPEHQLGTAYGFMQSIQNLGLAVVAIAAGRITDEKGYLILEVFFLGCLSVALIFCVLLYLSDAARGGFLNLSATKRNALKVPSTKLLAVTGDEEKEPLLKGSGDAPGYSPIRPSTANEIRNRFLARVGGVYLQLPDSFRTSAFAFPHPLR